MPEFFQFMREVTILYCISAVGYIAKRGGVLSAAGDQAITQVVLYITLPALILHSMDFSFSTALAEEFVWLLALSAYMLGAACSLAFLAARVCKPPPRRAGVYQGLIVFGNQGFIGYAVCHALFSGDGIVRATVFNIPFLFLIWTYGVYLTAGSRQVISRRMILLNPGVIATATGLLILIIPFQYPHTLAKLLQTLGAPTTPLSMILIGSLLANLNRGELWGVFRDPRLWLAAAAKLLLVPLSLLPFALVGLKFSTLAVAVLLAGMPSAPTVPLFAQKYGSDACFGSAGVFITTFFSFFSLPLIYIIYSSLR